MTDRYINPDTGVNSGAGTFAAPWKDLEYALEVNRCIEGDTIYLMSGDYSNIFIDKVTASQVVTLSLTVNAAAHTTIMPYDGASIEIQTPANAQNLNTASFFLNTAHNLIFKGLSFTNPLNYATNVYRQRTNDRNIESVFEDCHIDKGTSSAWFYYIDQVTGPTNVLTNKIKFSRCVGRNIKDELGLALRFQTARDFFTVEFSACDVELSGTVPFFSLRDNTHLIGKNNNFKFLSTISAIVSCEGASNLELGFFNSRIDRAGASESANSVIKTSVASEAFFTANPSKWDVKNNICWDNYCTANLPVDTASFWMSTAGGYLQDLVVDRSNIAIPLTSNDSYGWGNIDNRPTKALLLSSGKPVIGGTDWFSSGDNGCYKNPVGKKAIFNTPNTLMFYGDSITDWDNYPATWWNANANNGITAILANNDTPGADSGIGYQSLMTLMDWASWTYRPEWGVMEIGANNLDSAGARTPTNLTNQRLAEQIIELMKRMQFWGIKPIWLGVPSLKGNAGGITEPQAVNSIVEPICKSNGWVYGNIINYMISKNVSWQTVYYDAYATDVHPNAIGRQLFGEYALKLVNEAMAAGATYGPINRRKRTGGVIMGSPLSINCKSKKIDVTDVSASVAMPATGNTVYLYNSGLFDCYVTTGVGTQTATIPSSAAVTTSTPIPAGSDRTLAIGAEELQIAAVCASGESTTILIQVGQVS